MTGPSPLDVVRGATTSLSPPPATDPSPDDVVTGETTSLSPRPAKLPPGIVAGVVAVCVIPIVLTLLGVDFGSRPAPSRPPATSGMQGVELADALHQALAGSFTHTLLEWTAFCVALLTAFLALLHFRIRRDVTTPVIGVALLCAGTMDAFHTLAAVRLISAVAENERLIPFTWALSRVFNALILMFGIGVFLIWPRTRWHGRASSLAVVTVVFGTISYLTIYLSGLHLASDEGVITILYLYFWRESAINLGWLMNAHIPQTILVTS